MLGYGKKKQLKTVWRDKGDQAWNFFCPLCEAERSLPYKPDPAQFKNVVRIGLTSLMFTFATWNWFTWKGIVAFVPFWALFELFYRTRYRAHAQCSKCGFDPFLTLVDAKRARLEIENHWRKVFAEKGIPYPEKNQSVAPATAEHQTSQ